MSKRYQHWFWNSSLVDRFHQRILRFTSWLWKKQYGNR